MITSNTAAAGAGIASWRDGATEIRDSLIGGNTATGAGGAIHVFDGADLEVINCTLAGNTAATGGAIAVGATT
jgi:hypothetical protein